MKKLLLSVSAVVAFSTVNAQIFTCNDAAGFNAFSALDVDGDGENWGIYDLTGVGTPLDAQGECAMSFSWDNTNSVPLTPDNLLISPAIDCSGQATVFLGWAAGSPETTASGWYEEHYAVYVVTDPAPIVAGTYPTPVFEGTLTAGETMFAESVNISAVAANQATVYVIWRHYSCTDENWLTIDDIVVSNTSGAGIEENVNVASVYPNPASTVLNVSSTVPATTVSILSYDGKVISTVDMNGTVAEVSVADLTAGVYFCEIVTENGEVITNTFIKK